MVALLDSREYEDFGGSGYSPSDDITAKFMTRAINPGTHAVLNGYVGAAYEKGGVLYRTDSATVATYLDGEKGSVMAILLRTFLRFPPRWGSRLLPLIDPCRHPHFKHPRFSNGLGSY